MSGERTTMELVEDAFAAPEPGFGAQLAAIRAAAADGGVALAVDLHGGLVELRFERWALNRAPGELADLVRRLAGEAGTAALRQGRELLGELLPDEVAGLAGPGSAAVGPGFGAWQEPGPAGSAEPRFGSRQESEPAAGSRSARRDRRELGPAGSAGPRLGGRQEPGPAAGSRSGRRDRRESGTERAAGSAGPRLGLRQEPEPPASPAGPRLGPRPTDEPAALAGPVIRPRRNPNPNPNPTPDDTFTPATWAT